MSIAKKQRRRSAPSLQGFERGLPFVRDLAFNLADREIVVEQDNLSSKTTIRISTASSSPADLRPARPAGDRQKVFVVYGRNRRVRDSMFCFLRCIGLEPLEWEELVRLSGEGSPNVASLLEQGLNSAAAVVVILTPDDEVRLRSEFLEVHDPDHERKLTGQARPNVLFEAGMAFARLAANTIVVQVGQTRPFTDIGGRQLLRLTNEVRSRQALIDRLKWVGCNVTTARARWRSVGNFKG